MQSLKTLLVVMTTRMTQCTTKYTELDRLNPEYRTRYVIEARNHANHLLSIVQKIVKYVVHHFKRGWTFGLFSFVLSRSVFGLFSFVLCRSVFGLFSFVLLHFDRENRE